MLQSGRELESRGSDITIRYLEADAINDAIESLERLFNATPAACHQDLNLLAEAIVSLKMIKGKIEPEEGYEMVYKLY